MPPPPPSYIEQKFFLLSHQSAQAESKGLSWGSWPLASMVVVVVV